jgi:hypothetical protein
MLRAVIDELGFCAFNWNIVDSGSDHVDVLNAYRESLPDEDGEIFRRCKEYAGSMNLQGIDAVVATDPTIPVFIFIKGYLKAGKTINTKHITAVIDLPLAKNTNYSKVDGLVQGLVGRCCGYGKNTDVLVFSDTRRMQAYVDWIEGTVNSRVVHGSAHSRIAGGVVTTLSSSAYFATTERMRRGAPMSTAKVGVAPPSRFAKK